MTTAPIGITINGERQVRLAISRVAAGVRDLSKPIGGSSLWERWRQAFFASETELFASQGSTGRSGAWRQLSPLYKVIKDRLYPGQPILVASGAMRASLTGVGAGSVYLPTARSIHLGTEVLAGYHWTTRKAIDISDAQETTYFGRALVAWGRDLREEWDK